MEAKSTTKKKSPAWVKPALIIGGAGAAYFLLQSFTGRAVEIPPSEIPDDQGNLSDETYYNVKIHEFELIYNKESALQIVALARQSGETFWNQLKIMATDNYFDNGKISDARYQTEHEKQAYLSRWILNDQQYVDQIQQKADNEGETFDERYSKTIDWYLWRRTLAKHGINPDANMPQNNQNGGNATAGLGCIRTI